jgi:L-alanine-DL-glutamate epimerase-like enolase superfamily enzyme
VIDSPIEKVEVGVYTVPTDRPEADGTIAWDATTITVVRVSAGGELGVGWTYGAAECGAVIRSTLAPILRGRDPMAVTAAWEAMVRAVRNSGRQGAVGYAISAVDVALWDLKARLLALPLHRLIGPVRDSVPVYGSGGFTTYSDSELDSQLSGWTERNGVGRVKIKIGESWGTNPARDVARIRRARSVIGDDIELFVDANGGYSAKQAVRILEAVADCDVRWFEEPVSSDDLAGLARVREAVTADVAAGEYGFDLVYFRRMLEAGAVDCLQVDASRCGGITEWLRVASLAHAFGLQISGHCAPNLHASLAAATPNLRHLEWFHDHERIESLFFDGALPVRDGVMVPEARPGNGFALRVADAERYRVG